MEYLPNELKINLLNLDKATYIKLLELADAVISYGEGRAIICWSCFSIFDTRDMNLYPKWRICKHNHGEDDWWDRSYYVLCKECENTDHIKYCPKTESSNSIC